MVAQFCYRTSIGLSLLPLQRASTRQRKDEESAGGAAFSKPEPTPKAKGSLRCLTVASLEATPPPSIKPLGPCHPYFWPSLAGLRGLAGSIAPSRSTICTGFAKTDTDAGKQWSAAPCKILRSGVRVGAWPELILFMVTFPVRLNYCLMLRKTPPCTPPVLDLIRSHRAYTTEATVIICAHQQCPACHHPQPTTLPTLRCTYHFLDVVEYDTVLQDVPVIH